MRARLSALLLLFPALGMAAECPKDMRVAEAAFSTEIRERSPVDTLKHLPEGEPAVYFFSRIRGGAATTVTHEWFYGGESVVKVPLPIAGPDWRTWSSKNLGYRREEAWAVRVLGPGDCLLGEYRLPAVQSGPPAAIQQARQRLEDGDMAGARLAIKEALDESASADRRDQLQAFLDGELELARIERQIETSELYTATARLRRLLDQPLNPELRARALALQKRLARQRSRLVRDAQRKLAALEQVLATSAAGSLPCRQWQEDAADHLDNLLGPEQPFVITGQEPSPDGMDMQLLDRRTGTAHPVTISCFRLPASAFPVAAPSDG